MNLFSLLFGLLLLACYVDACIYAYRRARTDACVQQIEVLTEYMRGIQASTEAARIECPLCRQEGNEHLAYISIAKRSIKYYRDPEKLCVKHSVDLLMYLKERGFFHEREG